MELVLDASVIIRWFLKENLSKEALRYRRRHLEGQVMLVAPTLLAFEFANVLCTKPNTNLEVILSAIDSFYFTCITEYILTKELAKAAARLSEKYKIFAYDTAYVALAQDLGCPFITADRKLYQKVKSLGFVDLLD